MTDLDELVQRLLKLDTCAVSDALDKLGLTGIALGIVPTAPPAKIAGRVVTMKLVDRNAENSATTTHLGTKAIEAANPGDVIVVQHGRTDAACWGGILSAAAKTKGVAGVICDGAARDIDEARELEFPVFSKAATPMTARGRVVEESHQEPVLIGRIAVNPGDLVLADGSGVALIAASRAEEVIAAAEVIAAREALMKEAVLRGDNVVEVMGRDYEQMLAR
ncbi:MAG: RraA family protein [Dehalococcoidia bacterium]|nr:RraA family protein [Dehalococcoidia bacterium]